MLLLLEMDQEWILIAIMRMKNVDDYMLKNLKETLHDDYLESHGKQVK